MRIKYNILWFENDQTSYETKKEFVKEILDKYGFDFPEPQHEVDGTNIDNLNFSNYDLIIADMNLDKNQKAMELIDHIRKKSFTEVLFYSSSGEDAVRAELTKYHIDGAYCSGRENIDFEEKVEGVIHTIIKKTQDLTNLRGLVMAEVSELDVIMEEIIKRYYINKDSNSLEWENFQNKIIKKIQKDKKKKFIPKTSQEENGENKVHCKKDCSHIWSNEKSIENILNDLEFDSSKKAHTIYEIAKQINMKDIFIFEEYNEKIIQVRNNLAHSKSEVKEGKEVLVTKKMGEICFNQDSFIEIRKDIKKYREIFEEIEKKIQNN